MKFTKILSVVVAFVAMTNVAIAQKIKGVVVDEQNEPLVGATLVWAKTIIGVTTNLDGSYELHRVKDYDYLIASYVGFKCDTVLVESGVQEVNFQLKAEGLTADDVIVEGTRRGNFIAVDGITKDETISFAGLCKMACCTLAESFENSASVTVGYSDAISGARQIKMLGLTGNYTQILDESRAIMRGLSSPYGLTYTPGMWLNSIQVSKGVASVTAGHEAITGQVNLEHRKSTDEEKFFLNLYLDDELRPEVNLSSAFPVSKDGKLTTVLLFHGSKDTEVFEMDYNDDGFRDMPVTETFSLANRWLYSADSGVQIRWGMKALQNTIKGGMIGYDDDSRDDMYSSWSSANTLYGSNIKNREASAYLKVGMPVGRSIYDEEDGEFRSNVALVADFSHFNEDAYFGLNDYAGTQNSVSMNLMYNHYFSVRSSLKLGVQAHLDYIDEKLLNETPWLSTNSVQNYDFDREEHEAGVYAEYTYSIKDKFSVVAGVRGDYNNYFDEYFATPRGHIRWNITPTTTFRASAGLGTRTTSIITDNIGILTTGRRIVFADGVDFKDFDRMETAATYGGSLTQSFNLIREGAATISVDYFRTQFSKSVVVDQERDTENIYIYNSDGDSYTDTYQVDFSWQPIERFDIFATYRYTNSEMSIIRNDGSTAMVERPLVSRYKTLLNLQYATRFHKWTFDATLQYNGPSRMPTQTGDLADSYISPSYPMLYAQVTRKIGMWELYVGCENITNYRQDDAIISSENPFSTEFNSMNVWGPLKGRKFYAGVRFNIY
ncbi:MAG: TonB-dependent receptor [Rikenellaceae bacterium]